MFNSVSRQFSGKIILFSADVPGTTWYPRATEYSWTPSSHHTQKINSEWITNLDVRDETIKLPEENIGKNLHDLRLGKVILDMTPKSQVTKEK